MADPTGQTVDFDRLRKILDSPVGAKMPAALRLRMLSEVQSHEGQMLERGNINLNNRPQVRNADGSISTVRSFSAGIDGKEVLLPTVGDNGQNLTENQAVDLYKKTGKHLGIFASPEAADQYAQALHGQQEASLGMAPALAPRDDTMAPVNKPPTPFQAPAMAPMDVTARTTPFDRAARYALAKQVAIQNTDGLVNQIGNLAVMQPTIFAMQLGHDMTLGLAPSPYGEHADPETMDAITRKAQIPIRIVSGITTMLLQGNALMKGLTFAGNVPRVARALEFIPTRVKEIGLSALINGGIDALRADGLQRDQNGEIISSWLDPSTKIAKPLAELGIPDRVALGLGGGVVGAVIGPAVMGIASGYNMARTRVVARMSDETIAGVKNGLAAIGIGPGEMADKYRVAQTFIKNFRKIAMNEDLGTVMADQLSKEQYIANEIASSGAGNSAPKVVAQVLRNDIGDLANSGFHTKPDAAVVLPNAGSLEIGTVDAIKGAIKRVGPDEFKRRVELEMAQRSADPLAQAAATEETARRILAQPEGTKSAYELLQEVKSSAFADTPAHQAAVRYAQEMDQMTQGMNLDPTIPREAILDRVLRDKMFNADGSEYGAAAAKPPKPGGTVQPAGPTKVKRPLKGGGPMEIPANLEVPGGGAAIPGPGGDVASAITKLNTASTIEMDGRLMAGIFRSNPGGVNLVTNVAHDAALIAAQEKLGVKLVVAKVERMVPVAASTEGDVAATSIRPQTDYMIGRPIYNYPLAQDESVFSKATQKITGALKSMATEAATSARAPKTTEAFILHDGTPVRGGLNTGAMIEKMHLQKPMVEGQARGDLALQHTGQFVRLDISEGNRLSIELPRQISKEQFTALGKAVDTMKFDEVTVRTAGGEEKVFQTPIGAVVQDHIANVIPPKSVGVPITPQMVAQYKREGVFAGQAAVLPDGSVGEIVSRSAGMGYKVKEAMTGAEVFVHKDALTILPSLLEGEMKGSNLFTSYLDDAERNSLARMRKAVSEGWAKPITKYRDMEQFASSRGYISDNMRGGKIRLTKVNEGGAEPILFKDMKSAVAWIRNDTAPMAELADDEVSKLLGPDRNVGFLGGGGPPPRMNEMMPIDWKRQEATMEGLKNASPGFFETKLKPMLPLLRGLDDRFGTQMYKAASNMQSQGVAKANFEALWYHGIGGELPKGVKPLGEIVEMAGRNANQELITDWREADAVGKAEIAKNMTPKELKAAQELGKWYDAAYPALGVGAPFVENYMPRYREAVQSGNSQSFQEFMASMAGDPLKVPKGTDWVSDHIRNGYIDTYNKNAFQVAVQYLRGGAKNRFMKVAQNEAREMVQQISAENPNLALPLANMLQAMGGYEFAEQRAMLNETFKGIMDRIPGTMSASGKQSLAEKLTNWSTSLVYASTMGFRPSLALRNAKDIYVMSYPIYGGPRFHEAVGRALTEEGKQEAMAARVISNYGGGMLAADEETAATIAKMPKVLQDIHAASTTLYDSADEFTRTGTYFAAKFKAEEALQRFAAGIEKEGTAASTVEKLKKNLIRDSKMYLHGEEAEQEFLRRAAQDPDFAAKYAGKQAADFTNFLYGRGMQARWMRSIGGRFFGQFGSWSMWYADYLGQTMKQAVGGEFKADAMKILARHALVNAAILETGKQVLDVDLSRWASYGALAYSGGPGVQLAMGASTLMRGMGDMSSFGEDPLAQTRVSQGSQMIWQTLPAFVPFHSAFRDVSNTLHAYDSTELLAATLGTKPTKDYVAQRKVDILLDQPGLQNQIGGFQSTSGALGTMLNNQETGQGPQPVDLRTDGAVQTQGLQLPPTPQKPAPSRTQSRGAHNRHLPPMSPQMPNNQPQTMETKPTGSTPVKGY